MQNVQERLMIVKEVTVDKRVTTELHKNPEVFTREQHAENVES
jgi:hypothetical protein